MSSKLYSAKETNHPPILYKYRTFDKDGFGLKLAIDAELYFSSPFQLNDPFETYFFPYSRAIELGESALREFINAKTMQHFPKATDQNVKRLNEIAYRRFEMFKSNPEIIADELHEVQNNKFGILSLTSNCKSIPMWAYYADNHKGFCVGLNMEYIINLQRELLEQNKCLIQIHRVIYSKDLPIVCIDTPLDKKQEYEIELETIHYTKSEEWKHEEEYRVIFWDNPKSTIKMLPEMISEVIFGLNTTESDAELLSSSLLKVNPNVKLLKVRKKTDTYGIDLIKIQ